MEAATPLLPLSSFADEPVYNVKAVCVRTGITAATLRAWERRYGLPTPNRTRHGYRLYSERDVAILFWLIQQTESGVSIGQAVNQLTNMLVNGAEPSVRVPVPSAPMEFNSPRSPESISADMVDAMHNLDERRADQLFTESSALYTLETTLINVVRASLQTIMRQRHNGEATLTVERFAMNYCRQRVQNLIQTSPSAIRNQRPVVTIGFRNEHADLDLLILALMMRRAGWSVVHLGTELDPHMVEPTLESMDAAAILYYVDRPENAVRLVDFKVPRTRRGEQVWCAIAGRALTELPTLQEQVPFEYLGMDLRSINKAIISRLHAMKRPFEESYKAERGA